MLLTQLTKMNKREKLTFYLAALVLSFTLVDRIVVGPIAAKMKFLDEKIAVQKELIRKNARIVADKDRVAALAKEYSVYARKPLTNEEEVASLQGEIDKIARKASLYIVDMKPSGVEETALSRKYAIDLNCEAQMEQIVTFIHDVENSKKLFVVETFNISPKSKDSSVAKCNLRISSVIFL